MFRQILDYFNKPKATEQINMDKPRQIFSTGDMAYQDMINKLDELSRVIFKDSVRPELKATFDSKNMSAQYKFAMDGVQSIKSSFFGNEVIPNNQLLWYLNHTFIGYQICAILAQQWLVSKCCLMPAEDATRKGYEITVNSGDEIGAEILDEMRKLDVKFKINYNCIQFIQFGRIFGIRIAMFKVDSDDPEYYFKPFNPDGVKPGSYKGISQIDPYWVTPQLDPESAGDPSSIHFYEPTWWNIAGKLVHRTHLIIYRTEELADILKPTYIYGGIPIPQKIAERVYAAERTANEAPMLALTKRTDVIYMDNAAAISNEFALNKRINQWVYNRDNYGIKTLDFSTEKMEQFDTALADLDNIIMTQYQLVAAASNVPAVKLLGTSPKGFNATGEYEESSYHEMLESLQTHALSPLIERHHLLLIRSEIAPKYNLKPFNTTITWKPLDAMTNKELSELNRYKAETGAILMNTGAIDGYDERERIINDPDSGYTGLNTGDREDETAQGIINNPVGGSVL